MPLTHVCMWDTKVGYRRVTVEEACEKYPYGLSAKHGYLVCELCAQNVLLTAPGQNVQHFRHDPSSPNKECDERQAYFDPTYGRRIRGLNSHELPLRLQVTGSTFTLQIGFFYPPDDKACCDKIRIADTSCHIYEYSFERIDQMGLTYLNVGSIPSEIYNIEYVNANIALERFWPSKINGIYATGSFFDGRTGRMLQPGGKAYSENVYYLLQRSPLNYYCPDIEATEVSTPQSSFSTGWHLYIIRVKKFSINAAKFFLKYAIFLTQTPTKFYPIWPPYIKTPFFIYHNVAQFYFYLCGDDAELKSYPASAYLLSAHDGRLYKLYTREREQLVSLGNSGALGFSYLIRQPLNRKAPLPRVVISDCDGKQLDRDWYTSLPKSKVISVLSPYDGKVVVQRDGKTQYIYQLYGKQCLIIDRLSIGTEIQFFLGCDKIRSICFKRKENDYNISALDAELMKKLKVCSGTMIPITHEVGALAGKFDLYSQTKAWIHKALQQGKISRKALSILKSAALTASWRDNKNDW